MREKSLTHIMDLYDFYAIRVIVSSEAECYQVLGLLHKLGRPVTNRFKDYIAFPKPNGYQSLHTTLAGLPGTPSDSTLIEVQVRTAKMHREAQYGVAAHWMYKEGGSAVQAVQQVQLHNVLASQQSLEDGLEAQGLADHIFVLTPQGDVIELPEGATPLDFAFQVHTDLGLSFRGARVNGAIVPLDYQLENGDIVEIMKLKTPQPSPHWMQLLKMASSRSKLKRFLYAQQRPELLAKGRELVNIELRKHSIAPLDTSLSILRECDGKTLNMQQREDLLMKIGQGAEKASSLLTRLAALSDVVEPREAQRPKTGKQSTATTERDLLIEGGVPLPTRFAKCCKPETGSSGNKLIGVINRTGVVVVHRHNCGMLRNANPQRKIAVRWKN